MVINQNSATSIPKIAGILKRHKTVILKCDTIYGIIGKAPETFASLCDIKGRSENQSFLILIPAVEALSDFTNKVLPVRLRNYWPGPLTVIFPDKSGTGTVAIRVPDDPYLIRLMQEADCALYSTSVNFHGAPPLSKIADIIEQFSDKVDLIVESGDLISGIPSTIIDICDQPYKLIRQGGVVLPREWFHSNE